MFFEPGSNSVHQTAGAGVGSVGNAAINNVSANLLNPHRPADLSCCLPCLSPSEMEHIFDDIKTDLTPPNKKEPYFGGLSSATVGDNNGTRNHEITTTSSQKMLSFHEFLSSVETPSLLRTPTATTNTATDTKVFFDISSNTNENEVVPASNQASQQASPSSVQSQLTISPPSTNGTFETSTNKSRRTNPPEKRFLCHFPQCTCRFARSDELKRHLRGHNNHRPYECEFCHKCFTRSDHLRTHRRIHTGERPFACSCGKSFARSDERTRHLKTHEKCRLAFSAAPQVTPSPSGDPQQQTPGNMTGQGAMETTASPGATEKYYLLPYTHSCQQQASQMGQFPFLGAAFPPPPPYPGPPSDPSTSSPSFMMMSPTMSCNYTHSHKNKDTLDRLQSL